LDIPAAIQEALEYRDDPPPNEASTCEWVILPILHKLGYAKRDVVSRDADSAGKFPDYTLLPGDPQHTFYLEAKAWKVDLEDGHANQALNYANQNGRRWVVLTNGHHWCLYDNNIRGLPSDKMAAEMHIENRDQSMRFLEAIGKASVCSDKDELDRFATEEAERRKRALEEETRRKELEARRSRLSAGLEAELTSQSSPLVAVMLANLRTRGGLGDLTADDLVAHFSGTPPVTQTSAVPFLKIDTPRSDKVLVIPARFAWDEYKRFSAYVCQANRSFRPTTHLAFYVRGIIETAVPQILDVVESVELSDKGIVACRGISETATERLRDLLRTMQRIGCPGQLGQTRKVVFLTPPDSPKTIRLPHPIKNDKVTKKGHPWAFVVGQRYVSTARLLAGPMTTSELTKR